MDDAMADLQAEQQTMVMTLHVHAVDAAAKRPVLGDRYAAGLIERAGFDTSGYRALGRGRGIICGRALALDRVTSRFVTDHPDGVVLHLACGLDSRVLRVDPGPGVSWYEIDQDPVIDVRRRLYEPRPGVTLLAGSVTDADRWTDLPTGRPVLAVAEGLFMYLPPQDVAAVLRNLAGLDAPSVTLVGDTVNRAVRLVSKVQPNLRDAGTEFASTTSDFTAALAEQDGLTAAGTVPLTEPSHPASGALRLVDLFTRRTGWMIIQRVRSA